MLFQPSSKLTDSEARTSVSLEATTSHACGSQPTVTTITELDSTVPEAETELTGSTHTTAFSVGWYGDQPGNWLRRTAMNGDLKYPSWQEPLAAAILEFSPRKLPAKIQKAETAIARRFQELAFEKDGLEESRLLFDGRSILRDLKRDRL
jgi:hypothetical protein